MKTMAWLAVMGVGVVGIAACGGSSATGGSAGSTGAGGGGVEGCDEASTAVSAGDVTINFPTGATPAQYSPACVKVHKGAKVTWKGAFASHPLTPDDTGGAIKTTSAGTAATFTFSTEGEFGYHCAVHPSLMRGAIFVVP